MLSGEQHFLSRCPASRFLFLSLCIRLMQDKYPLRDGRKHSSFFRRHFTAPLLPMERAAGEIIFKNLILWLRRSQSHL
jgi:hypothetical protein